MTQFLTPNEFLDLIMGIKDETEATIILETKPKMNKGGNPYYGSVVKNSEYKVKLAYNYERDVNEQRAREGKAADFKAQPTWGERVSPCLVKREDAMYVDTCLIESLSTRYFDLSGSPIEKDALAPFLPARKPSPKQDLDSEVRPLRPKFENVRQITIGEDTYVKR